MIAKRGKLGIKANHSTAPRGKPGIKASEGETKNPLTSIFSGKGFNAPTIKMRLVNSRTLNVNVPRSEGIFYMFHFYVLFVTLLLL